MIAAFRIGLFVLAWATVAEAVEPAIPRYYDLRLYTVTSGKMDGVMERFRGTVDPVRRKHGIETVGYWSAPGTTNGGTFAYLLSARSREGLQEQEKGFGADPDFQKGYAASDRKHGKTVDTIVSVPLVVDPTAKFDLAASSKPRAFDLRIYSVLPGKLDAFRDRWRDHAVPIYERHGLHSIGWWVGRRRTPRDTTSSSACSPARASSRSRDPSLDSTKIPSGNAWKRRPRRTASCAAG
jgi:hypothetical protein